MSTTEMVAFHLQNSEKMVKVTILIIISFTTMTVANAQNRCDTCNFIFEELQELPRVKNMNKFIGENLRYPESAKKDKVEGKVFVSFWIDTLGYTSDHKVIKGIRPDLDEEALRVARLIKFDKPAMNGGKPVKVVYTLPFDFRMTTTVLRKKNGKWKAPRRLNSRTDTMPKGN